MAVINGVGSSGQNTVTDSVKKVLGKDDFLKLMITQLKYQNPLEPTDNKDFIAQMAQFSSLEQMTNMSTGLEKLMGMQESTLRELTVGQAVNLIGHTVSAVSPDAKVTAKVNAESAVLYTSSDFKSAILGNLTKDTPLTVLGKEGNMLQVETVAGVKGYLDESRVTLDPSNSIIGIVTGVKIINGVPNVVVNGKALSLSIIEEVKLSLPLIDDTTGGA